MQKNVFILQIFLMAVCIVTARDVAVRSAAELAALSLKPGDKVILLNGEWKDQRLVFKGDGTEKLPISLVAETPGKIKLTGNSNLNIDGKWLIADGLLFADGYTKDDVITFTKNCSHSRLANTVVIDFNPPDRKTDYRWVSLNGDHNRVDHCFFAGKSHQGPTMVVWLSAKPNFHRIDHNYFGPRPLLGGNGGETIRIGTSTWSMYDSYTIVENNIFEHCDGELEIISNKSCRNTLRNNLFFECNGTLTLRHGNYAQVYGNYFIGNNKSGTGGIRVIGENHKVYKNHMQELTGTGVSAAISMMAGLPNPILVSHWQVKNASITDNVVINCVECFAIGAGINAERYLPALNTVFSGNVLLTNNAPLKWYDDKVVISFKNNIVWKTPQAASLPDGFVPKDIKVEKDQDGVYRIKGKQYSKPFWKAEKIGPGWMDNLQISKSANERINVVRVMLVN